MRRSIYNFYRVLFALEFLFCTTLVYSFDVRETPINGLPSPEHFRSEYEDSIFLAVSPDGKHTIGNLFPGNLLVDGKLLPCKEEEKPDGIWLYSNPWDDRILAEYSCLVETEPVRNLTLWVGKERFLNVSSSEDLQVIDFWLEPVPEQNQPVPMAVLEKSGDERVQFLDPQTVRKIRPEQMYWRRTFVSPSGEQTIRLETDPDGKQRLTWVEEGKTIIQDCDAIHHVFWLSEELSFEVYSAQTKEDRVHRWSRGKWDVSASWPEFNILADEPSNTFQIEWNSRTYGPFMNAHSRIYSLHTKHAAVFVQFADSQKWGILTDEGLAAPLYDHLVSLRSLAYLRTRLSIETNHWHTLGFRDGKWYRVDFSW